MKISLNKLLARISHLRGGKSFTISEFARRSGVSRSVLSKLTSSEGAKGEVTTKTLDRIVATAVREIRVFIDQDRLSDVALREAILMELLSEPKRLLISSKRQANRQAQQKLKDFREFPQFDAHE